MTSQGKCFDSRQWRTTKGVYGSYWIVSKIITALGRGKKRESGLQVGRLERGSYYRNT